MISKHGLYAYAVVGNRQVKMDNISLVNYKDLTLIGKVVNISDFQKELQEALKNPKAMEVVLTEHQGFLDRLMRKTTVIPFQFGTILKDKKGAIDYLKSSYTKYKEQLEKFKNRQEWGVRVFADLKKLKTGITKFGPESKEKLGTGTSYLLRKKQEEEAEKTANGKLADFSGEILTGLKEFAFEYKVTESAQRFSQKGELLISVFAFLLDKAKIRKFNQKLKSLQKKYQKFGLSLTASGPWPAYNFISPASPGRKPGFAEALRQGERGE